MHHNNHEAGYNSHIVKKYYPFIHLFDLYRE